MSATITRTTDSATTTPTLILGYETSRESRNTVHDMLDGTIVITLIKPRPRTGTLQLLYPVEADAQAALELHATNDTYELEETDRGTIDMTYVAMGLSIALDEETRDNWIVSVTYQEIEL